MTSNAKMSTLPGRLRNAHYKRGENSMAALNLTEEEAEAFAKRLKRIWGIEAFEPAPERQEGHAHSFSFRYHAHTDAYVLVLAYADTPPWIVLRAPDITVYWEDGLFVLAPEAPGEFGELSDPRAAPWMPLFRRNAWLSGCPIEASAHEKAEWIQGFTQEEANCGKGN